MDKEISPGTQERIRKLCGQITVAHDLDPEIQDELYGHMEDKLHAYLAGEEKLSEEDAYMLTRRHFGDASALKVLLQDVHDRSVRASLARRLAAALVTTVSLTILTGLALKAALVGVALWVVQSDALNAFAGASIALRLATSLLSVGLLWYVLARWQRQLARGERPWFVRWPAHRLWAAAGAALIASSLIPGLLPSLSEDVRPPSGFIFMAFLAMVGSVPQLMEACVWLWWSDRPPRAAKGLLRTALAWALLQSYLQSYIILNLKLAPVVMIAMNPTSYLGKPIGSLAHGSLFGTSLQWSLVWPKALLANQDRHIENLVLGMIGTAVSLAITALLAWGLYRMARVVSARIASRHVRRQAIA